MGEEVGPTSDCMGLMSSKYLLTPGAQLKAAKQEVLPNQLDPLSVLRRGRRHPYWRSRAFTHGG